VIRDRQSTAYRQARDELLAAEVALKDQREEVAALRRRLPPGAIVEVDYVFREGPADLSIEDEDTFRDVRLSELFAPGKDELIVDHMMFAPGSERGCPMCSLWADGYDAVAHHVNDRLNFVLVARAPLEVLRAWGRRRGWRRLRLLSSFESPFNADLGVEITPERQLPALSVFTREADGTIRHFASTEASLIERHHRGIDLFTPVWSLFDLTPRGRGDWMPKHFYDE